MGETIDLGIEGLRDFCKLGSGGFGTTYAAYEATVKESATTSMLAFSPAYTPPETFETVHHPETGEVIDPRDERSDLYSLAATLYAAVAGDPPFTHPTHAGLMAAILMGSPPATGHDDRDEFFATAMAVDPDDDRHPSAVAFAEALRSIAGDQPPVTVREPSPSATDRRHPAVPHADDLQPPNPSPFGPTSEYRPTAPGSTPRRSRTSRRRPEPGRRRAGPYPTPTIGRRIVLGAFVAVMAASIYSLVTNGGVFRDLVGQPAARDDDVLGAGSVIRIEEPDAVYRGHSGIVHALAQLPDGRIASGDDDGTVRMWDRTDLDNHIVVHRQDDDAESLALLADGRIAIGSAGGLIHLRHPDDPSIDDVLMHGSSSVDDLAVGSDGTLYAAGSGRVDVWPADDDGRLSDEPKPDPVSWRVLVLEALREGRLATGGAAGVYVVENPNGPFSDLVAFGDGPVTDIIELDDGRIAAASGDGIVEVWDPDSGAGS